MSAASEPHISDSTVHWLRLHLTRGIGPKLALKLVEACGSAANIWKMGRNEWRKINGFGPKLCTVLEASCLGAAEKMLAECMRRNIHLLCPEDSAYPANLSTLDDSPLILFAAGDISCLHSRQMLAVIGARHASREGILLTKRWCHFLSDRNVCIISGMACGIDQAAHNGALSGSSPTIAVLGCGLGALSSSQQPLVRSIAEQGCVLSEYLPSMAAKPEHFPQRNRIISALSQATLIMEAGMRSGSLITARLAGEQGKDVMAVPGSVLTTNHAGCHHLIRDGAILIESAKGVLSAMSWNAAAAIKCRANTYSAANDDELSLLQTLAGESMDIDHLAEICGLTVPDLSPILLRLELQGVIERLPGSRYILSVELH